MELIAAEGYRLLPFYRFDPRTGLWHHISGVPEPPLRLTAVSWAPDGQMTWPGRRAQAGEGAFPGYLDAARAVLATCPSQVEDGPTGLSPEFEALRWFPLPPASVAAYLKSPAAHGDGPAP